MLAVRGENIESPVPEAGLGPCDRHLATAAHDLNRPASTTDDAHARNNSSDHPFDVVYGLDSLNRVISADEGNIDAGAIESGTRTRKELWNSLSLTGNWGNRQLDSNGDGDFGDEPDRDEPSAYNTFNKANEWTARRVAKAGGSDRDEHAYTYDAVGNLTDLAATAYRGGNTALTHRRLVYDAFGRLVRVAAVEGMDETDVALYRYNGLNMRLMWQDDADADSTLESSERFYIMHDERWRPVATFRDADAAPKEAFVWHAAGGAGQGGFGGSSYIDSLILRDRDNYTGGTLNPMTSPSDGTLEERRVFCQNWRADVVAVTRSDGTPIEYVRYSAYGEPTVYPVADLNMDGVVNSTDSALWSDLLYSTSNASVYADSDLDFDGADDWNSGGADGDLFYESYTANTGLSGVGRMSSPSVGNRVGYAGYQWDQTLGAYHVRYRVYLPDIGRWTRRDPLGYVDGMSLFEYVKCSPVSLIDAKGLDTRSLGRTVRAIADPPTPVPPPPEGLPEDVGPTPAPYVPPAIPTPPLANICCWNYVGVRHCEIVIGLTCGAASGGQRLRGSYPLSVDQRPSRRLLHPAPKSCSQANWNDIHMCVQQCETRNPYTFPTTPFWNCQKQSSKCAAECCLESAFVPDWYADPPAGPYLYPGMPGGIIYIPW